MASGLPPPRERPFRSTTPRPATVLAQVAEADKEDVDRAVTAARNAFDEGPWTRMTGSERGKLMWKLAELLDQTSATNSPSSNRSTTASPSPSPASPTCPRRRYVPLHGRLGHQDHRLHHSALLPRRFPVLHAARASRRRRTDHPLELPAADGGLEARSRFGGGLHDRPQGRRTDPAQRAAPGRADPGSRLPRGRRQYPRRLWRDGGRRSCRT